MKSRTCGSSPPDSTGQRTTDSIPSGSVSQIEIVPATVEHAESLAPRLREADLDEVWASGRHTGEEALTKSVKLSTLAWTALFDGQPEVMWGVAEYPVRDGSFGIVWLLSSPRMYEVKGRFLEESKNYVAVMNAAYDTIFNYVHAANIVSQKWLLSLGFHKVSVHPDFNGNGETFILFAKERSCVSP